MFSRIARFFRSIFGAIIGIGENPRLILEQSIRDMRDKLPEMNTGIAKARAGVIRLENENTEYQAQARGLTAKIKACLTGGDETLATRFAVQLKGVQEALGRNQEQLNFARSGYETLLKLKERYHREMERKTQEAMSVIRAAEAVKWKEELAGVFESFEVSMSDAGTHDEMVARLRNQNAEVEGKLAMAVDSVEMRTIVLEEQAREIEGRELLEQFKLEMGLAPAAAVPAVEGESEKTVGVAAVGVRG